MTVVCGALFLLLCFSPHAYVGTYGAAQDAGAAFMVRRASPMFLGLAVGIYLIRNEPNSAARRAMCWLIAVAFAGIAVTGISEYIRGFANLNILAAAGLECLIAAFAIGFTRAK